MTKLWIESHTATGRHPKVLAAAEGLNIGVPQMVGHLHLLWHWTIEFYPKGEIPKSAPQIERAAMWEGEAPFVPVLVEAGFLDEGADQYFVHDWYDFAGRLIERREKDAERKAESRKRPQDVRRMSAPTVPNRTVPNRTIPNQTKNMACDWFEEVWKGYPRREGKKAALKHFLASVKGEDDLARIKSALERYRSHLKKNHTEPRYIQKGSTWFNNWEDWTEVTEVKPEPVRPRHSCEYCQGDHQSSLCPNLKVNTDSIAAREAMAKIKQLIGGQ